jgi:hypothetical protein
MPLPALVARRRVWVPTLWGWLALALVMLGAGLAAAPALYPFLAPNDPPGARVLAVEGWMPASALEQAATAIRKGQYELVLTTGGPSDAWPLTHATYAERAADYLKRAGVSAERIVAVPAPPSPEERTYRSAVAVREWAKRNGARLEAIDVYSLATHARRTRLLYRRALGGDVRVGVRAANPVDYDPAAWWRTSAGARQVLEEAIGLLWVGLFFQPSE